MQNLKAVAMGAVAAIAFFWSSVPNPAIASSIWKCTAGVTQKRLVGQLQGKSAAQIFTRRQLV
jgi:hypothetical protein